MRVDTLTTQINTANQNLFLAETALASFKAMATTAGSPIMGPNRLTAQQLADFIRNNGYTPHITVTIDELASYYIDEGAEARHPRRCRLRPVDHRDRRLQLLREHGRGRRQQLRRHRRVRLVPPRLHLPRRPHRRAGPAPTAAGVRRPDGDRDVVARSVAVAGHAQARVPRQGAVVVGPDRHLGDGIELRHRDLRPLHAHGDASRRRHRGRGRGRRSRGRTPPRRRPRRPRPDAYSHI